MIHAKHRILFLDIDGVLNGHEWDEGAGSNRIRYHCIRHLNRVIAETACKIVLSSAWRYMIHGGAMTMNGFDYLLRTHGTCGARVVGITLKDEELPDRPDQIAKWLADNGPVAAYAVVDDDFEEGMAAHPFVKTEGSRGLSQANATELIRLLTKEIF